MSGMPRIVIETIPHQQHRYPTVGDYFPVEGGWTIRVSRCGDARFEFLVALHEFVEWFLTQERGIREEDITEFDVRFEEAGRDGEPGDDPQAPYHREHVCATKIEREAAAQLGVDWDTYEEALNALFEEDQHP
jgi:hypothetical protein